MTHSKLPPTILDIAIAEKNKSLKVGFLKQWTRQQFKMVESKIASHFREKEIQTLHGNHNPSWRTFDQLDEIMGLAYTSSSSYAGYWICNTEVYSKYEGYHYIGFALSQDGKAYGILWDKDENEIITPL